MSEQQEKLSTTFFAASAQERDESRQYYHSKYKSLDKSSIFCDILVEAMEEIQKCREKYEDGILILHGGEGDHDVAGKVDDLSEGHDEIKNNIDKGMQQLFEGLKIHMQIQDYLETKYNLFNQHIISTFTHSKQFKQENLLQGELPLTVKMENIGEDSTHTIIHDEFSSYLTKLSEDKIEDDEIEHFDQFDDNKDILHQDETRVKQEKSSVNKNKALQDKKYSCQYCHKLFSMKKHLIVHLRVHTGETPYECNECEKKFKQLGSLNIHKKSHTGDKPFRCDQCTKQYGSNAELKAHQRIHTGEKPFKCNECPKAFALHTSLKHHKMTHTGEKPFKCDQCGHGFIHKGQLNTHIRSHTGEKPFKCDQCGRGFTRSFDLGTHMRTHTGEKPYKCSFCPNAFAKKHTLDNHIRIHTGEKPYKCEYCEKQFRQQGDMAKHRRKKHNVP